MLSSVPGGRDSLPSISKVDEVLAVVARIAGKDASILKAEDDLVVDLGIDSPRALELLVEIEEVMGIEISDEDAARLESVGDIVSYVDAQVSSETRRADSK